MEHQNDRQRKNCNLFGHTGLKFSGADFATSVGGEKTLVFFS